MGVFHEHPCHHFACYIEMGLLQMLTILMSIFKVFYGSLPLRHVYYYNFLAFSSSQHFSTATAWLCNHLASEKWCRVPVITGRSFCMHIFNVGQRCKFFSCRMWLFSFLSPHVCSVRVSWILVQYLIRKFLGTELFACLSGSVLIFVLSISNIFALICNDNIWILCYTVLVFLILCCLHNSAISFFFFFSAWMQGVWWHEIYCLQSVHSQNAFKVTV